MPKLLLLTLELTFYHLLICFVDRLIRLPRASVPPDAMRLYWENLALKVQLDALAAETTRLRRKRARMSLQTRAAQVWAYLVTRGNRPLQKHNLTGSPRTIWRWATSSDKAFRRARSPDREGGARRRHRRSSSWLSHSSEKPRAGGRRRYPKRCGGSAFR